MARMMTSAVEVVFAPEGANVIHKSLEFTPDMTVNDVLLRSGLLDEYPEIASYATGIFGRCVSIDRHVKPGDRVEVYRSLIIDPKARRRQRAKG